MAAIEKIKDREKMAIGKYGRAIGEYDRAKKRLEEWEKEEKGKKLELERKLDGREWKGEEQKERWEENLKTLKEEKKRLEDAEENWGGRYVSLAKTTKGGWTSLK